MRSIVRFGIILLSLLAIDGVHPVFADTNGHSHFRYGHYIWTQVNGNIVEVTLQNAFRRDGYSCTDPGTLSSIPCSPGDGLPQVGDVIVEFIGGTQFNWGDGTSVGSPIGPLLYKVTSIDPTNNWLFGLALDSASLPAVDTTLFHTYAAPGNYVAFTDSCCRISSVAGINEHINNPDTGYRVETIINVGTANKSPISALPPIVLCPIDALCSFLVPGSDPDGNPLNFRLSTSSEASSFGTFIQPGPPHAPNAASIDPITGLYTWDTIGATLAGNPANNTLYSTQVTIEDSASKVALDFLIQLVKEDINPPVIEPPADSPPVCNTTQIATVGNTKTFDVVASDPDSSDVVTLNVAALPIGATMTPSLPVAGNPVSSTFSWTPGPEQIGQHVVNFNASSSGGGFTLCSVTIQVNAEFSCSADDPQDPDFIRALPEIEKYLKKAFKIANLTQDVLVVLTQERFKGTELWKTLIFLITADEFFKKTDKSLEKINHEKLLLEFSGFTAEWGFTSLLTSIGLRGVAATASIATLPIISSIEAFHRKVKKTAINNQIKLYLLARTEGGCSAQTILNREDSCPKATLSFTDDGWLHAVATNTTTLSCGFRPCFPRPLTPGELYEYTETLRSLNQIRMNYSEDKATIQEFMQETLEKCL